MPATRPALTGDKARLPEPPRKLTPEDVAILRGNADSMALRLGCHDVAVHRRLAPENAGARAVFDAVEQARVEAIGSRRMAGVASNLTAMLEDRYHRGGKYEDITDRADAPMEDAVALMVRERLTGEAPPKAARKIVDLWRSHIEEKAGPSLDGLIGNLENQRSFARSVRELLSSLDMADETPLDPEDDDNEDENEGQDDEQTPSEGEAEEQSQGDKSEMETSEEASRRVAGWRHGSRPTLPPANCRTSPRTPNPRRPPRPSVRPTTGPSSRAAPNTRLFNPRLRRDDRRRGSVRRRRARAPAHLSRQAARPSPGRVGRLANRLQRRLLAQQNRAWEFDLEEGQLDPARPRAGDDGPVPAALVQAREGHEFSRYRRHAAAR